MDSVIARPCRTRLNRSTRLRKDNVPYHHWSPCPFPLCCAGRETTQDEFSHSVAGGLGQLLKYHAVAERTRTRSSCPTRRSASRAWLCADLGGSRASCK